MANPTTAMQIAPMMMVRSWRAFRSRTVRIIAAISWGEVSAGSGALGGKFSAGSGALGGKFSTGSGALGGEVVDLHARLTQFHGLLH